MLHILASKASKLAFSVFCIFSPFLSHFEVIRKTLLRKRRKNMKIAYTQTPVNCKTLVKRTRKLVKNTFYDFKK